MASIGKFIGRLLGGGDRALHDWVLALLEIRPGDAVLEIGCGPGAAMKRIVKTRKDVFVVGVDASEEAVEEAWRKNARAIKDRAGDAGADRYRPRPARLRRAVRQGCGRERGPPRR